jgi:serine O-acetyltransferase
VNSDQASIGVMDPATVADPATSSPNPSLRYTFSLVREDWKVNGRRFSPGFQALAVHRFGVWAMRLPRVGRRLFYPFYVVMHQFVRNFYGIEIHVRTVVGRRVWIPHQSGICINRAAVIGDGCMIRQNVTLGSGAKAGDAPILGRGVELGPGAVIIGKVRIGDGVRIGPNAVVMTNVPAGATVVANPPRVIRPRGSAPTQGLKRADGS